MALKTSRTARTLADLLEPLGVTDIRRIRFDPVPGTATKKDVTSIFNREHRLYELVDGILIEKIMGAPESMLTIDVILILGNFVKEHDLGVLLGADGTLQIMPGLVRIPDISFVSWKRLPDRKRPTQAIPALVPNLAVEGLSKGNTRAEMRRKLKEYFLGGVEVVWFIDPRKRTVRTFSAPDVSQLLTEADTLAGGALLPGLSLPVRTIFANVPHEPKKPNRKKA